MNRECLPRVLRGASVYQAVRKQGNDHMRNIRGITAGIGIVLVGCTIAACGGSGDGAAGSTSGSPAPAANAADGGSSQSAEPGADQLGPDGLGELSLGMTVAEAKDTGMLGQEANGDTGDCEAYVLDDSVDHGDGSLTAAWFSAESGLGVLTTISSTLSTPQGIAKGASEDEARTAYPELGTTGTVISTDIPGNEAAVLSFTTLDGEVASVTLGERSNECFQAWFETQQPGAQETSDPVLGPDGFGELRLGMGYEEAAQQGLVTEQVRAWQGCATFRMADDRGTASFLYDGGLFGVTVFTAEVQTPEGVGVMSTVEELQQAYPDGYGEGDSFTAHVPDQGETYYTFDTPEQGPAGSLTLLRPDDGCMG